jgi:exopolysaccharide/PEP-CTERM locus tyrosine autokinase
MSIIEKALDKSEDKGEPRQKSSRPAKSAPTPPRERSQHASRRSEPAREPLPPLPDIAEDHPTPPNPERLAPKKNRPEFPRQTLKTVTLNLARLDTAGIITPESKRAALVEQFRTIKRPILMKASSASDKRVPNGNLVLVTSAVPGEGKTFTTVNLAMSIAMELDHTVLLVDADAAKSDVSRLFELEEAEGLTDYLAQPERALSEFLVGTDIEKLTVLPAGRPRANVTELLASEHMRNLVNQFGQRYTDRIVVIDSPPMLAASGASILAHLVGQTVFVVEAIRTAQSAVEEALSQLSSVRNIGLVLNKSRSKDGLGFQYGSYYAHSSDKR